MRLRICLYGALSLLLLCIGVFTYAHESLKLMAYNIYRYPYHTPNNRESLLADINEFVEPDLLMVSELVDEYGADRILNVAFESLEDQYLRAPFIASEVAIYDPLHQMVFYNSRKLQLVEHKAHLTEIRDINQFTFYLKTTQLVEEDTTFLEVFVCHLKSSNGNENRWKRKSMVDTFFKAIEQLPADRHVVFAGDFNFYEAHIEPAYNKIISPNNWIKMKDPIDAYGSWHANEDYSAIHTQSTRISTQGFGTGGAGGGVDDRFDFIFLSKSLMGNDPYISFMENSYETIGNNGNCFKNRIDSPTCSGFYPQKLRESLYYMSDHLPVALSLQINDGWIESININENKINKDFQYLPKGNLVQENLWVKTPSNQKELTFVEMINSQGSMVYQTSVNPGVTMPISLVDFRPGLYFIRILNQGAIMKTYKIIKH